jgi:hypothetical protein
MESSEHRNEASVYIKLNAFFFLGILRAREEVTCGVGKKTLDPSSCPSAVPSSSLGPTSTNHLAPVAVESCHVISGNTNFSNRITGEMEVGSRKVLERVDPRARCHDLCKHDRLQ